MTQTSTPMTYEQLKQSHDEWRMLAMHNYGAAKAAEAREQRLKEGVEETIKNMYALKEDSYPHIYEGKLARLLATLYPDTPEEGSAVNVV